ncbi:MAG TPA: tRNA guanosine(34) transglycosylase Tgt, partial [Myxococcales bacterium]|nr:tRNA guanosine(34) transglycosylase Tgt [Myxococcales bacterium]
TFTRAYLRHLFNAQELLAFRLNSLHNLAFYMDFMSGMRAAIEAGSLRQYAASMLESFRNGPD